TDNKPKCLVPLYGKPILYSISNAFDEKLKVTIIEDYKADVLESYLNQFPPPFDYSTVRAEGKGTCAGVQTAIENIGNEAFILVWSDLFFTRKIKMKKTLRT
ncbi:MAG: nucleoside-diphosphate-sugar pyrophosphorylase, partial [Candidatus Parvarchaeota archaeon]